jgi:hypothetical protein
VSQIAQELRRQADSAEHTGLHAISILLRRSAMRVECLETQLHLRMITIARLQRLLEKYGINPDTGNMDGFK